MTDLVDNLLIEQHTAERDLAGAIISDPLILRTLQVDITKIRDELVRNFLWKVVESQDEILQLETIEDKVTVICNIAYKTNGSYTRWLTSNPQKTYQEIADEAIKIICDLETTRETLEDVASQAIDQETEFENITTSVDWKEPRGEDDLTRERFRIYTAAEALEQQPPPDWIIDNLFSTGSVSLLVGKEGAKKTYTMIHAGICVALGKEWLEFKTQQCKVLVVDEESGPKRFKRRLHEVMVGEFADEKTPFEFISLAQVNMRDAADTLLLYDLIERRRAKIVFIDALADIMPGGDENAVKDVQPVFMRFRKIADELNCAIVIIHHTNKLGGYRGSTAMGGAVDLILAVNSEKGSNFVNFASEKARDIEEVRFTAEAHWTEGQFWLSPTDFVPGAVKQKSGDEYVLRILKENGPLPLPKIQSMADTCSPITARNAVYRLAKEEEIYRTNKDAVGRGTSAIYALREDEPDVSALLLGGTPNE